MLSLKSTTRALVEKFTDLPKPKMTNSVCASHIRPSIPLVRQSLRQLRQRTWWYHAVNLSCLIYSTRVSHHRRRPLRGPCFVCLSFLTHQSQPKIIVSFPQPPQPDATIFVIIVVARNWFVNWDLCDLVCETRWPISPWLRTTVRNPRKLWFNLGRETSESKGRGKIETNNLCTLSMFEPFVGLELKSTIDR